MASRAACVMFVRASRSVTRSGQCATSAATLVSETNGGGARPRPALLGDSTLPRSLKVTPVRPRQPVAMAVTPRADTRVVPAMLMVSSCGQCCATLIRVRSVVRVQLARLRCRTPRPTRPTKRATCASDGPRPELPPRWSPLPPWSCVYSYIASRGPTSVVRGGRSLRPARRRVAAVGASSGASVVARAALPRASPALPVAASARERRALRGVSAPAASQRPAADRVDARRMRVSAHADRWRQKGHSVKSKVRHRGLSGLRLCALRRVSTIDRI
mmetsp:Transcript_79251/g.220393  ORF Transcript_79251/g.220393 Transcript_79251/m.220393 type:complete len:274 (-) Transcript_79251:98-919(-)